MGFDGRTKVEDLWYLDATAAVVMKFLDKAIRDGSYTLDLQASDL